MRENEGIKTVSIYAGPVACLDQAEHHTPGHCEPLSRWMLKWLLDHVILLPTLEHIFVVLVTKRGP